MPAQDRPLAGAPLRDHDAEIFRQHLVVVRLRGLGLAVTPCVVGDQSIAAPGKRERAVQDVSAGSCQAVQKDDRWPLPHLLTSELHRASHLERRRLETLGHQPEAIVTRVITTGAFGLPEGVPSCSILWTTSKPADTRPTRP